jgi:hypothetical protein
MAVACFKVSCRSLFSEQWRSPGGRGGGKRQIPGGGKISILK